MYELLIEACQEGDLDKIKSIMANGDADVNIPDIKGNYMLYVASEHDHLKIVKYLLENGAKVDTKNRFGYTSLCIASENGHLEIVEYLLDKGARVNAHNFSGDTSLYVATVAGHLEVVRCLLKNGAKINIDNFFGEMSFCTVENFYVAFFRKLFENVVQTKAEGKRPFWTPLHVCVFRHDIETVKCLIEYGSDVEAISERADQLLSFARQRGSQEIFDYLNNAIGEKEVKINKLEQIKKELEEQLKKAKEDFYNFLKSHDVEIEQLEDMLMSEKKSNIELIEKLEELTKEFESIRDSHNIEIEQLEQMLMSDKELTMEQAQVLNKAIDVKDKTTHELTALQIKHEELLNRFGEVINDKDQLLEEKTLLSGMIKELGDELAKMRIKPDDGKVASQKQRGSIDKVSKSGVATLFGYVKGRIPGIPAQKLRKDEQEIVEEKRHTGASMHA